MPIKFLRAFLVILIVLLTSFFTFFVPPINKPDENVHFYKAIAVSQGQFVCGVKNNRLFNPIPVDTYIFVNTYWAKGDTTTTVLKDNTYFVNEISSCVLPFYYYIVPGFAIAILSKLGASIPVIFFSGRLINAVLALTLLYVSVRKLPLSFQLISLYVFSLPMVSFQISSYSKDAYHVTFGLVLINFTLYLLHQQKARKKDLFLYVINAIAFILTRIQYGPFLLLFLALPKSGKKFKHTMYRNILLAAITICIAAGTMFVAISNNMYLSAYNTNTQLPYHDEIDPQQQLLFIASNPLSFFMTCVNTVGGYALFFVKGMIGILGWLDKPLPNVVYILYVLLGLIVIFTISRSKEITLIKKIVKFLFGIVAGTLLSLFTAMYLYGSPVGFYIIYGLQGRYFIMLIPLVMLLLALAIKNAAVALVLVLSKKATGST